MDQAEKQNRKLKTTGEQKVENRGNKSLVLRKMQTANSCTAAIKIEVDNFKGRYARKSYQVTDSKFNEVREKANTHSCTKHVIHDIHCPAPLMSSPMCINKRIVSFSIRLTSSSRQDRII